VAPFKLMALINEESSCSCFKMSSSGITLSGVSVRRTGTQWLRQEVWVLFSEKPAFFSELIRRYGALLGGDFIKSVVRREVIRQDWPYILLRCYVVSHRFQSFVDELCAEHGYTVPEEEGQNPLESEAVCLCRGCVTLEVTGVNTESGSGCPDLDLEEVKFVSAVYKAEALHANQGQVIHLMSVWMAVCLPSIKDPKEKRSGLLPVVGAVCCKGHSPRCFPTQQESDVVTEEQLNKDQEQWVRYGHLLGPAPAELWFLRHGLCLSAFEEADGFD